MKQESTVVQAVLPLVFAAACWGVATVMTKYALGTFSPISLLVFQLTVSTALLWLFVWMRGLKLPTLARSLQFGWIGLLNPGISYTLSLIGLTTISASLSALLWSAEPIFILGLAWLLLRERLPVVVVGASLFAVVGVVLVGGAPTLVAGGQTDLFGTLLTLLGVGCCALYTILAQKSAFSVDPLLITAIQQAFALVWALAVWPFELRTLGWDPILQASGQDWLWAGLAGVLYYGLAFWLYIQGLANTKASVAGVLLNLIPVFAVGVAHVLLGERLLDIQWIGGTLILASVLTALVLQNRSHPAVKPKKARN